MKDQDPFLRGGLKIGFLLSIMMDVNVWVSAFQVTYLLYQGYMSNPGSPVIQRHLDRCTDQMGNESLLLYSVDIP